MFNDFTRASLKLRFFAQGVFSLLICLNASSGFSSTDPCATIRKVAKTRDFVVYAELMDAAMQAKIARIMPFLPIRAGAKIVDVGTGTGTLAAAVALQDPAIEVVGVDIQKEMIEIAESKYSKIPNLSFKLGYANKPYARNADAVVLATVLHEIFSYSGDSYEAVDDAFRVANQALKPGGTIVIKDFVKPSDGDKIVHFQHRKDDFQEGNSFENFAKGFQKFGRKVPYRVIREDQDFLLIETELSSVYEYIFRKDYKQNWEAELAEKYGFITLEEVSESLEKSGFSVVHTSTAENHWISENRIIGKVSIVDPVTRETVAVPHYDMLVVATKK